jgi:hypothetical protein
MKFLNFLVLQNYSVLLYGTCVTGSLVSISLKKYSQYSGPDHLNPVIFGASRIRICYCCTNPDPALLLLNMTGIGPRLLKKIST